MNISIISLGKFKQNPPFEEIFNYYKKRISLNIDLKEIKTFNFEKNRFGFQLARNLCRYSMAKRKISSSSNLVDPLELRGGSAERSH